MTSDQCEDVNKPQTGYSQVRSHDHKETITFDQVLEITGRGRYNYTLLILCIAISQSACSEIFSTGLIATTAQCDLKLNVVKRGFIGSVPMLGIVASAYLWGYTADTRGRQFALTISIAGTACAGFLASFSNGWVHLAVCKFMAAIFASGSLSLVYSFLGESTPATIRPSFMLYCTTGLMCSQAFIAGMTYPIIEQSFSFYIGFLGFYYRPWRLLMQVIAVTNLVCLLCFRLFTMESPKFYIAKGDQGEGMKILKEIYKINKGKVDYQFSDKEIILQEEMKTSREENFLQSLWRQTAPLFEKKYIKKTLLMTYTLFLIFGVSPPLHLWFQEIFNRYGMAKGSNLSFCEIFNIDIANTRKVSMNSQTLNSTVQCFDGISKQSYLIMVTSATYLTVMSLISILITKYIGKKRTFILFHVMSGVSAIIIHRLPLIWSNVPFLGMLTNVVTMGIATNYIVEMFPTYMRAMAVSLIMMFGRGFSFIVTNVLGYQLFNNCNNFLNIIGVFLLSGSIVGFLLPSTEVNIKPNKSHTIQEDKEEEFKETAKVVRYIEKKS